MGLEEWEQKGEGLGRAGAASFAGISGFQSSVHRLVVALFPLQMKS